MNPRAERKPLVIRVSLDARAPHYSWFIQTRAARFYYFLVTWQGTAERGVAPLSAILRLQPPFSTLSISGPSLPSGSRLPCSPLLSSQSLFLSVCLARCHAVEGTLLKNCTSKPLEAASPVSFHRLWTSPRSFREKRGREGKREREREERA